MIRSKIIRSSAIFALVIVVAGSGRAQVGNDNPTGPSGQFNGNVTTGGSYDPYTANATRSITDLVVAGSVGAYPLAFTRNMNTRYIAGYTTQFGQPGAWRHSYQWSIDMGPPTGNNGLPTSYTVNYPDGRRIIFAWMRSGDRDLHGPLGVRERFEDLTQNPSNCYLRLPDGGKIWFTASSTSGSGGTYWTFQLAGIIDPYGQVTTVTWGSSGGQQFMMITEPAGRMLKIFYRKLGGSPKVVDRVEEWMTSTLQGRTVTYSYTSYSFGSGPLYYALAGVSYPDGTSAAYTYQNSNVSANGSPQPLIKTCVDPMYAGSMWKIAYTFVPSANGGIYGQVQSENYSDGSSTGVAVTGLTVNSTSARTQTRADSKTQSFSYSGYTLSSWTDFRHIASSAGHDSTTGFINSFTDRNANLTGISLNPLTGILTQATFPQTPEDAPPGYQGTISYTYGSPTCQDSNNRDASNPYYPCTATDEAGNVTKFKRDTNMRVTEIDYPDNGKEFFQYNNSFGQVTSHTNTAGGLETFVYDGRGLLQEYYDIYHTSSNPNVWCQYDSLDRVRGATDALGTNSGDANHTTTYAYNLRGQLTLTTLPPDPDNNNNQHTIKNTYNPNGNGTLVSTTDQLGNVTSYSYDDYKRVRSVTSPGHNTPVTAQAFYDANGTGDDYSHGDANVTHTLSPSGEKSTITYDENYRTKAVTVAVGTSDVATTSYGYDNNGNVTSVISPKEQPGQPFANKSTLTAYDERNRVKSVTDPLGNATSTTYDNKGRRAKVTRANGQVTTFDSYDPMNRLRQQTVKQTPDPDAITKYSYYTSGLLQTMQDPRLVANGSSYAYTYVYDLMRRQTSLTYPPDSNNVQRSESWHYQCNTSGHINTFTNRAGNVQTTTYDALGRTGSVAWNDGGVTPTVSFDYDGDSRPTTITNPNATISYSYFNDGLLNTEITTYADHTPRTVTYSYNADGNRATIQYPNATHSFTYQYTGRNQLWKIINNSGNGTVATYAYDPNGNLSSRAPDNTTSSSFSYDGLDRVTHMSHALSGTTRTFDYDYDSVGNRKWTKRDGTTGDVFGYDQADQAISILFNMTNPDTTSPGPQTIMYDANGNRTTFTAYAAYGQNDTYTTNDLNQYTTRQRNQNASTNVAYDNDGNMTTGLDGSTYTYDAQNRLLSATNGGSTETFKYDGLNRQVSRTVGSGAPVYNVYDGWDLIGEYAVGSTSPSNAYLFGAGGIVKNLITNQYYYQDASGSTSHLADINGNLLEWYRYDLQGAPVFVNPSNIKQSASAYGIRHLFTGQQWYKELGLYDLRNRFYSPDIGRFLQGDPADFNGDATNLYRYCGNNPLASSDPSGLITVRLSNATGIASPFGHIGVGPDATTTRSFYGDGPVGLDTSGSFYLTGNVHNDGPPSSQRTLFIPTSPGQDGVITATLNSFQGSRYAFGNRNCATAVGTALHSGGLEFQGSNFPATLFHNLLNTFGTPPISPSDPGGYVGADGVPVLPRVTVTASYIPSVSSSGSGFGGISNMGTGGIGGNTSGTCGAEPGMVVAGLDGGGGSANPGAMMLGFGGEGFNPSARLEASYENYYNKLASAKPYSAAAQFTGPMWNPANWGNPAIQRAWKNYQKQFQNGFGSGGKGPTRF